MAQHFTDDNFEAEVIEASKIKPVLVDFYAEWCGPCKMQGPIIDEVASEIGDQAVVGKLNTEQAQATAAKYGVMSIPTLIIFRHGQPAHTYVGVQPKDTLMAGLGEHK